MKLKKWTLLAAVVGIFLMWGTAGALENDAITMGRAIIQLAIIIAGMTAAVGIGRFWEDCYK